jgi:hypothetical protein
VINSCILGPFGTRSFCVSKVVAQERPCAIISSESKLHFPCLSRKRVIRRRAEKVQISALNGTFDEGVSTCPTCVIRSMPSDCSKAVSVLGSTVSSFAMMAAEM